VQGVETTVAEETLRQALRRCVTAMCKSQDVGCTDHLDCADDGGAFWYDALESADRALKQGEFANGK
jgi:hypothetical protein